MRGSVATALLYTANSGSSSMWSNGASAGRQGSGRNMFSLDNDDLGSGFYGSKKGKAGVESDSP